MVPNLFVYILAVRLSTRKRLRSLLLFSGKYIYTDDSTPSKYTKVTEECVNRLFRNTIKDISIYLISISTIGTIPLHSQIVRHERMLFFPTLLPGTDDESNTGLVINQINQLFIGAFGLAGILMIELFDQVLKNAVWAQMAFISYDLEELNEFLSQPYQNPLKLKMRMRHFFAEVTDSDCFLRDMDNLFYWKYLLKPACLIVAISVSMFLFIAVRPSFQLK